MEPSTLVQYVLMRKDLKWAAGAVAAQVAHACVAAVWATRDAPATLAYVSDAHIDAMHKVVVAAESEAALRATAAALAAGGVAHKLWVEQPEGVASCLATAPGPRADLAPHFAAYKLLR